MDPVLFFQNFCNVLFQVLTVAHIGMMVVVGIFVIGIYVFHKKWRYNLALLLFIAFPLSFWMLIFSFICDDFTVYYLATMFITIGLLGKAIYGNEDDE